MKKIEIARSFSKTIQESAYEPVNVFASYKAEVEEGESISEVSDRLYQMAVDDVGMAISDKLWEKWTNPQKFVRKMVKENNKSVPF
jgi:hypothetical protein